MRYINKRPVIVTAMLLMALGALLFLRGSRADGPPHVAPSPTCHGLRCSEDWHCGSQCSCEGYVSPAELGTCVAKEGAQP